MSPYFFRTEEAEAQQGGLTIPRTHNKAGILPLHLSVFEGPLVPLSLSFPFWTDALSSLLQGGQSLSFSLGLALMETEKTYNWVTSIAFRKACGLSCT